MTEWKQRNHAILKGAIIIAFFSLLSKITGLLRVMILSSRYATGDIADAYLVAFRIPDLIFNTLVLGALSSAFIPIFLEYFNAQAPSSAKVGEMQSDAIETALESSETSLSSPNVGFAGGLAKLWERSGRKWFSFYLKEKEQTEKWALANTVLNLVVFALFVFSAIFFIFSPALVKIMVPSFDPQKTELTVQMTRIMLFSTILFGVSNVLGGMLQSFQRFFWFSIAPVCYNAGIIIGIVFLAPAIGHLGLAYGVVLGAFLHMAIQIPAIAKAGFLWRLALHLKHPGVKKILLLMLPRTGGLAAQQVNQMVSTFLASSIGGGAVAVIYYADSIQSLPVSIVGVSFAISAFPVLASSFHKKNENLFGGIFSENFRKVLFIMIPLSLFMIVLRAQIVRLVLGTGVFGWDATIATLQVFGVMALSVFAQGTIPLLARSFYARHDTITPLISGIISICVNIALGFLLIRDFGLMGLAAAFSVSSLCNMTMLWVMLCARSQFLQTKETILSVIKIALLSLVSGFAVYGMLQIMDDVFNNSRYFGLLGQTAISALSGGIVYFVLAYFLRFPEARWIFYRGFLKKEEQTTDRKHIS